MSDLKNLFVPYDLAVKLKEKGFDEKCIGYIIHTGKTWMFDLMPLDRNGLELNPKYSEGILSPLYQQVIDWFREKHMIGIHIRGCKKIGNFGGYQYVIGDNAIVISKQNNFTEYYEAYNEAIEEALKLI